MSRLLAISLLSFLCNILPAQERDLVKEMTENYIQIRQKPNTEQLLREWLSDIALDEDTVYAVLYVPMECPRCESAIPNFRRILKSVDPGKRMLLITAYPDSILAKDYNKRNGYEADTYLYDTDKSHEKFFETNLEGRLTGLHILKIDRRRGNLLVGGEYTVLSSLFVRQLIDYRGMMEKSTFLHNAVTYDDSYTATPQDLPRLKEYHDYRIDPSALVSTIYDVPRFVGSRLFFTDLLNNGVMLFTQDADSMRYDGLLQVNGNEKNRFVNIPKEVYEHYVANGMLYYMALGTNLLDESHIGISYSIPRVVPDGAENAYGLYNAPVIISRDINTMEPDSIIALNFDLEHETMFFNQHFAFSKHQNKIIISCMKLTWPMEYDREDYEHTPRMNPFCDEFYKDDNPFIAAFNCTDGNLYRRLGQLDTPHALSYTGYYFTKPISASSGDELLYSDGLSGKVVIVPDDGGEEQCYQAFCVDTQAFPQPDTTLFYSYDHIKPYSRFFNRSISDVRFDKKEIHCIVKYAKPGTDDGAQYVYTVIDRKNGKARSSVIPRPSESVLGCGLRLAGRHISPFVVFKDGTGTSVRVYSASDY